MVLDSYDRGEERFGTITRIANELGIGPESLRKWVRQAEIDRGGRPGTTTEDRERLKGLERENRELRRANEIVSRAPRLSSRRSSTAPRSDDEVHRCAP